MSLVGRAVVGGVATLAVVGGGVGWFLASAPEQPPVQVQVDDTADVLAVADLVADVEAVRFHGPTTVGVFTDLGGEEALTDDLALNDAVLAHAREDRTEWLSADGRTWADGLFVLAVDPEGRLVGTYFGEDREIGEDAQLAVQDATKDDFRAGRWTEGTLAGVEAAADRMGAPLIRRTGGVVLAGLAGLLTVLGAGTYLGVGLHRARHARRSRAAGDAAMAAVVRDHEVTELHARTIPAASRYGGLVLRRHDDYRSGFRRLVGLGDEARAIPERRYDSRHAVRRLAAYEQEATSLDHLDDVIADTAAFLNRDSTWVEAWNRQVAPVRDDLDGVGALLAEQLPAGLRDLPEAQALRAYASAELVVLDRLRGDLEQRTLSPDDALDRLRATRDGLTAHLDALGAAVARGFGKDDRERRTMTESLRSQRGRRPAEPSILATADPTWTWFALGSFRSGLTSGTSQVEQARSSSSSGTTSGYSAGGGFSGAGSSSRF